MPERSSDSAPATRQTSLALRDWSLTHWARLAFEHKYVIAACVSGWIILALIAIRVLPPVYTVTMVVGPKTTGLTQRADSGIAARILGAASANQNNAFEIYFELLTS